MANLINFLGIEEPEESTLDKIFGTVSSAYEKLPSAKTLAYGAGKKGVAAVEAVGHELLRPQGTSIGLLSGKPWAAWEGFKDPESMQATEEVFRLPPASIRAAMRAQKRGMESPMDLPMEKGLDFAANVLVDPLNWLNPFALASKSAPLVNALTKTGRALYARPGAKMWLRESERLFPELAGATEKARQEISPLIPQARNLEEAGRMAEKSPTLADLSPEELNALLGIGGQEIERPTTGIGKLLEPAYRAEQASTLPGKIRSHMWQRNDPALSEELRTPYQGLHDFREDVMNRIQESQKLQGIDPWQTIRATPEYTPAPQVAQTRRTDKYGRPTAEILDAMPYEEMPRLGTTPQIADVGLLDKLRALLKGRRDIEFGADVQGPEKNWQRKLKAIRKPGEPDAPFELLRDEAGTPIIVDTSKMETAHPRYRGMVTTQKGQVGWPVEATELEKETAGAVRPGYFMDTTAGAYGADINRKLAQLGWLKTGENLMTGGHAVSVPEDIMATTNWVQALDRGNFGRIEKLNPDGTAAVTFINPETKASATVNLPLDQLAMTKGKLAGEPLSPETVQRNREEIAAALQTIKERGLRPLNVPGYDTVHMDPGLANMMENRAIKAGLMPYQPETPLTRLLYNARDVGNAPGLNEAWARGVLVDPGWTTGNVGSNMLLQYQSGQPLWSVLSGGLGAARRQMGDRSGEIVPGLSKEQWMNELENMGAFGAGYAGKESARKTYTTPQGRMYDWLGDVPGSKLVTEPMRGTRWVTDKWFDLNKRIEDNARLSFMENYLKRNYGDLTGKTPEELSQAVGESGRAGLRSLIDYGAGTPTDEMIRQFYIPFWYFNRGVLGRLGPSVMEHPERFSRIGTAEKDFLTGFDPSEREVAPDYTLPGMYATGTPFGKFERSQGLPTAIPLGRLNPQQIAGQLAIQPISTMVGLGNPSKRTLFELLTNTAFGRNQTIEELANPLGQGVPKNPTALGGLAGLVTPFTSGQYTSAPYTPFGIKGIPASYYHLYAGLNPIARQMNRLDELGRGLGYWDDPFRPALEPSPGGGFPASDIAGMLGGFKKRPYDVNIWEDALDRQQAMAKTRVQSLQNKWENAGDELSARRYEEFLRKLEEAER